jgi:hypothetical protein
MPEDRAEVAAAAWRGGLVVAGGFVSDGASSRRVDRWAPGEGWTRLPDLPAGRNHPAAAVLGDRLYVSGGRGRREPDAAATVWSLGPGERQWRVEPPLSAPRMAHAMVAFGGRLLVAGGARGGSATADVETYDPATHRWAPGPPLATAREHVAGATHGGRAYVIAGRAGGLSHNVAVVESLGPGERAWRAEPALRTPRGGIGAAERAGELCVAGGETPTGTIPTVECLRSGRWVDAAALDIPRHGLAVVGLPDGLHVVAGGRTPGLSVSFIHERF